LESIENNEVRSKPYRVNGVGINFAHSLAQDGLEVIRAKYRKPHEKEKVVWNHGIKSGALVL
jgi:hypothetical protein